MFKREVSAFFVPQQRVLSLSSDNSVGGVAFDFFSIKEQLKEMESYESLCMVHTHDTLPQMSGIDWNMVYGWVTAFGVPIVYIIIYNGIHGRERVSYLCQRPFPKSRGIDRTIVSVDCNGHYQMLEKMVWDLSTHPEETDDVMLKHSLRFLRLLAPFPTVMANQNGKE